MQATAHQHINPNHLIQQGLQALQNSRPADARAAFEQLVEQGAVNASIWLAMAYACRDLGDHEAMQDAIDKSIKMEPRNPRAFLLRADTYAADGDDRAAAAFYLKALNVAPPLAQMPADLKPELARAQQAYDKLTQAFENHLVDKVEEHVSAAGEDSKRVRASLDLLTGKSQVYYQQPKTYYFPELPQKQFYDSAEFEWVPAVEAAFKDIRAELQRMIQRGDGFAPYVTGAENRPQSDPHGMKGNADWTALYLWRDGERVEENVKLCPRTVAAMEKVPLPSVEGRSPSVLFSALRPGAKIPPHHGLLNTRLICHLPLIVPEGCGFRVGNETRQWEEGKVWLFDDSIEHEAWNDSEETRYILLFEVWRPELSDTEKTLVTEILQSIDDYGDAGTSMGNA